MELALYILDEVLMLINLLDVYLLHGIDTVTICIIAHLSIRNRKFDQVNCVSYLIEVLEIWFQRCFMSCE